MTSTGSVWCACAFTLASLGMDITCTSHTTTVEKYTHFTLMKGLKVISCWILDGTVGTFWARLAYRMTLSQFKSVYFSLNTNDRDSLRLKTLTFDHSILSVMVLFSGSTCWAYFRLLTVYSWPQNTCWRGMWFDTGCSVVCVTSLTVSGGREERTSHRAWYISCAVPSKNFPHPPTNSVSPAHTVSYR